MKLRYIDALRGLAIIGVVIVHCSLYGDNEKLPLLFQSVAWSGMFGVQLFFMVSAFTLFLSLDNRRHKDEFLWQGFFIRRFFRVAPMYYLGILYFLFQDGFGARYFLCDTGYISVNNIISNFLFIHGFYPYWISSVVPGGWSITNEMLFYCLLPLLFTYIRNTRQAFLFVLSSLAFRLILHIILIRIQPIPCERLWIEYLYLYLPNQLPVFGMGILLYFIVKDGYSFSISPTMIFILSIVLTIHVIGSPIGWPLLPNHVLYSGAFMVLCIAASKYEFKILINLVIIHIGKVSYSMYLVHFAVFHWLNEWGFIDFITVHNPVTAMLNFIIRLLVVMALTVAISTFFYKIVELPSQMAGKKLIKILSRKRAHASL